MTVYNHLLFSELFSQQVRSETADLDNLRATLSTIRSTWQYYLPPPDWAGPAWQPAKPFLLNDVVQLRASVVEPIFAYLELTYGPCEADERAFFLYSDWAREDRTGLCLVLPYSADIEGRDPPRSPRPRGDERGVGIIPKGRNYAQQLICLLREHDLDWGVLTNGRHWRLFHRTGLSPTDTYLHVDLERIIADDGIEDYIVFHRFFSRSAFVRSTDSPLPRAGEGAGPALSRSPEQSEGTAEGVRARLDLYKQQSDEATKVIEDHLSAHVEEIARQLCQGLVESCRVAGEDVTDPAIRSAIYKNALFLVYRLLFVLYAEARDLLPLDAPSYGEVRLRKLLAEVRENHKHGMRYDDDYEMWERLEALFALIDQGDPSAGVPAYNGGLFDPGRRPFLTEHRIRNDYLQAALIRLSTVPARGKTYDQDREPQPIDYRDLSVRHLGSLYEGLLEYNLFVVEDEPRVVRVSQKQTRYVPYSQVGKVRATETLLQVGDVYFSETAGERKATGSYYTPEDVVDYIVRHTVGEKLKELKAEFYETQQIERQLADLADTPSDIPAHHQIQQALDDQYLRFVREKVLDLKILDPAMGSGHFLVNATHAVANFIVELLNGTPWENPEMDTDVATWKRHAAERCIFGVDLNELAVELAKLCLWMTTAAKGKPLTFLDHHLRWGNSLVGAWLKDVGIYPLAKKESEQAFTLPMGHFQVQLDQVLASYRELYAKSSDDVDEVREKARLFDEEIYPALQPYRELLDLHTGIHFGNGLGEETYAELGDAVGDPAGWARLKAEGLGDLLAQHAGRHWLHWELEFPEVFAREPKGLHATLGNPPYASYPDELSGQFASAIYITHDSGDLYALFLERSLRITQARYGHLGFIVPLSITFSNRMASLRTLLSSQQHSWTVYSFDKRPQSIFPNVQQRTSTVIGGCLSSDARIKSGPLIRWKPEERPHLFDNLQAFDCTDLVLNLGIPKLGSDSQGDLLRYLLSLNVRVGDFCLKHEDQEGLTKTDLDALSVYFFGVAYRWLVATKELPPLVTPTGEPVQLSGFNTLLFRTPTLAWQHVAILSSSLAFWFWLLYGDSFHVTKQLLKSLPISVTQLSPEGQAKLVQLGKQLQREMSKHVFFNIMRGRTTANYDLLKCRHITLEIDSLVGQELGLSQELIAEIQGFCARAAGLGQAESA
jgi:hypothetical protein